jgi:C-terminal processing protease CtpA/Prc
LDNVIVVGDKTGGGGGLPFSSELPNGWAVRFSASPMYDVEKQDTEFGIEPDVKQNLNETGNEDAIIEKAIELLVNSL